MYKTDYKDNEMALISIERLKELEKAKELHIEAEERYSKLLDSKTLSFEIRNSYYSHLYGLIHEEALFIDDERIPEFIKDIMELNTKRNTEANEKLAKINDQYHKKYINVSLWQRIKNIFC